VLPGRVGVELECNTRRAAAADGALIVAGAAVQAVAQGLTTLVHFSAQRKHFLWNTLGTFRLQYMSGS